ncbi:hypothetical protein [Burkholderia cenocepacia]|uniref:hypothetical protein n=1 Tax=Burkholderia cenocepacia TaxID=95486 RepID=UPI0006AC12A8|nr:hypothetical protein [Burkholderia cenocepacia]KOR22960.1 hypothetical protein ABW54_03975 [Burkholderia cenocepacia]
MTAGPIIRVEASDFAGAFDLVEKAIDRRSIIPAAACIRLRAGDDHRIEYFGTSAAGTIATRTPMKILQEGDFDVCVPAEKLAPLVGKASGAIKLSITPNGRLLVESARSRAQLPMLPGATMPQPQSPGEALAEFDTPGLGELIESVAFIADDKDIRDFCQGVWIESDGEGIHVVATNVLMMATNQIAIKAPEFGFMLMEKSAALLTGFNPERIVVMQDGIIAVRGESTLQAKKALMKYPAWRRIPPDLKNSITFPLAQLRDAISVHRFYDSRIGAVRFFNDGDGYQIEIKDGEHDVDFELEGVEESGDVKFEYAFKGEQLAKMLARITGDKVTLFWDPARPVGFLMQEGSWRGIVSRINL